MLSYDAVKSLFMVCKYELKNEIDMGISKNYIDF